MSDDAECDELSARLERWCIERGHAVSAARTVDVVTAAAILTKAPGTLANWRARGDGPEWRRCGGRVAYSLEALADFLLAGAE